MNGNGKNPRMDKDPEEAMAMMPKAGWGEKGSSPVPESSPQSHCGVGKCRPTALRKCGGIWSFTFIFALSSLLTSSLRTYMTTQFIFLERQYGLTASTTGLLVSCTDMGFLVVVLLISYFGRKWNIPRVLAIFTAMFGIAAILCALPAAKQDDLAPPPNVTAEEALSIEKLLLSVPSCMMQDMPDDLMDMMMAKLLAAKSKRPAKPIPKPKQKPLVEDKNCDCDSKTPAPTPKPTPKPTPAPTPAPETQAPAVEPDVDEGADKQDPETPPPPPPTTTTTTTTEEPVPEGPAVMIPDFTKLRTHPRYPDMRGMAASLFNIDMDAVAEMNLKDQLAYVETLPPEVKDMLPNLRMLLQPNPDDYFIMVTPSGKIVPSRKKRSAEGETKWIDISKDMMYNGQLAKMVAPFLPFPDDLVNGLVTMMCPFNTGPFHEDTNTAAAIFIALIAVGMFVQGIGRAPQAAFSTVYIDDAVEDTQTGLHLGIIYGASTFGLALAGGLGAVAAMSYFTGEDVGHMTLYNPRWLSAWWLGYVIYGIVAVVLAAVLLTFPRTLAKSNSSLTNNNTEARKTMSLITKESKGFFRALFRLLANPLFLLVVLGNAVTTLASAGYSFFLPKYIETQFSLPPFQQSAIIAALTVVIGAIGTVIGGLLTSKLRMTPLGCLKVTAAVSALIVIVHACGIGLGCDQPVIDKGDKLMTNTSKQLCSSTCVCVDAMYSPMCGSDGKTYYSPCHAGCAMSYGGKYHDCKCVEDEFKMTKPMHCEQPCDTFYPFSLVVIVGAFLIQFMFVPSFLAALRSVHSADAPLAIGFNSFLVTLLGAVPSPYLFGTLIDATCALTRPACGPTGTCAFYDIVTMRLHVQGVSTAIRGVAALLYIFALVLGLRKSSVYHVKDDRATSL